MCISLRCLPAGDEIEESLRASKGVVLIARGVVEDLHNQKEDEAKDEGSVEVTDIEGRTQTTDQGVSTNDDGEDHGRQFGAEIFDQGVEHCSAGNGQTHHDNQVGEEGKAAEGQVGALSKTGLDHLKNKHCS